MFVPPLKFVAMAWMWTPVLLMKSLTSIAGVTQTERRKSDHDAGAGRQDHLLLIVGTPAPEFEAQRVLAGRRERAVAGELPEQMPEQRVRIVVELGRIAELFHAQRPASVE